MARGRKKTQASQAAGLLEALKFVKVAAGENSLLEEMALHVRMSGNMAVTFDGQIAAGHPIAEELSLCPQIDQLTKALARSGNSLVISETPNGRLSIKGEKLQAYVPCLDPLDLPPMGPDPRLALADDRIKAAFKCCGTLASEGEKRVIAASLLLRSGDCTGTNGAAILQFWHGIDLPPNMVLPKVFCAAVGSVKEAVEGFGASFDGDGRVKSVTFFFTGGAWLKSLTYADEWPNIDPLWWQANYGPVPDGLFDAIDTVADFNDGGFVTFVDNAVQSHKDANIGARYDVKGLQGNKGFAGKLMGQVAPFCSQIDLTTYPDRAFFVGGEAGNPVRGIIMGTKESTHEEVKPAPKAAEPGPFVQPATEPSLSPAYTPDAGTPGPSPIGQNAQIGASPSDGWSSPSSGGWSAPAGGFAVDDDVEMPE